MWHSQYGNGREIYPNSVSEMLIFPANFLWRIEICSRITTKLCFRVITSCNRKMFWTHTEALLTNSINFGNSFPHIPRIFSTFHQTYYRRVTLSHPGHCFSFDIKSRCHFLSSYPEGGVEGAGETSERCDATPWSKGRELKSAGGCDDPNRIMGASGRPSVRRPLSFETFSGSKQI